METMDDFENQLQQEALEKEAEAVQTSENEYTVGGKLLRKDADGTTFEFDPEKRAWFPKLDEDFIARYQLSYGTGADPSSVDANSYAESYWSNPPADINSEEYRNWYNQYCSYFYPHQFMAQAAHLTGNEAGDDDGSADEELPESLKSQKNAASDAANANKDDNGKKKRKKNDDLLTKHLPPEPPAWFEMEDEKSTNVYVSGLPEDITEDEFKEFMCKVGVISFDPILRKPKLKLYTNSDGTYKGDGRCCYIKSESVNLALQILDQSEIRGHTISVERARFELKGQYDPSKKRRKLTSKEKKKFKEKQEKILGWQPEKIEDVRPKYERVVIIKYAFLPSEFEKDPAQINEISADFRDECGTYGDVRKVVVCDRHPDGVVMVTFQTPEAADVCVSAINRRWFDGRQLDASNWDGRTKYHVQETEEEIEKRLNLWHSFLEAETTEQSPAALQPTSTSQEELAPVSTEAAVVAAAVVDDVETSNNDVEDENKATDDTVEPIVVDPSGC